MDTLAASGFRTAPPEGAHYVLANYEPWGTTKDCRAVAQWIMLQILVIMQIVITCRLSKKRKVDQVRLAGAPEPWIRQ